MENRIALVSLNPFPIGNVATVRYSSYCKAIAKKGIFVKIYVLAPSKTAAPNKQTKGVEDGILYQYMSNKTTWTGEVGQLTKGLCYINGLLKSVRQIRQDKINCIILYSSDFSSYLFYWSFTRLFSIPLITDKSEYPYRYAQLSNFKKKIARLKLKVFDGFIIMTNELMEFYSGVKSKRATLFHLPMTIDATKFDCLEKTPQEIPYIAAVFGVHNRDGILDTVKSYKLYQDKMGEQAYKLWLIGDFDNLKNNSLVKEFIKSNDWYKDIVLKGLMPIENIPQILKNAECLITTAREYTSGGFPTKLGEYLASGTPVVTTSAGEVACYLVNGKNALVSNPGDITDISNNLIFVHTNKVKAIEIAQKGGALVRETFSAETYVDNLLKFIQNI